MKEIMMKPIIPFLICLACIPVSVSAQESGFIGMHHLSKPPAAEVPETKDDKAPDTADTAKEDEAAALPTYKTLLPKDALVKPEDLEKWDHLDEAAFATSDLDVQKLLHIIESDRGAVPPQGLFLAAKSLSDHRMMEKAALYYFTGQLRLQFDTQRWPPTANADDVKRIEQDNKKSADQMAPNRDTTARVDNAHAGIQGLGNEIGSPIIAWVMKDPKRMDAMLKQVKQWDASAPYGYLPDYDLPEPVAFDKWEKILGRVRTSYFAELTTLLDAMKQMKR